MHDLIFWYTGWIIWAAIGTIFAVIVIVGVGLGLVGGVRAIREWVACAVLARRFRNKTEREFLRDLVRDQGLPPGWEVDAKFRRWLRRTYAYIRRHRPELVDQVHIASAEPWQRVHEDDDRTKPARDAHDYYGPRYSVVVQLRGFPGRWRWDYRYDGWVDAGWEDGPDPDDYGVPVTTAWKML